MPNPWELIQSQVKKMQKGSSRFDLADPRQLEIAERFGIDPYEDSPEIPTELKGADPDLVETYVTAPSPSPINSAFRTPEHNKAVGGVDNSQHLKGLGLDVPPNPAPSFVKHMQQRGYDPLDEGDHVHFEPSKKSLKKQDYGIDYNDPRQIEIAQRFGIEFEDPRMKAPQWMTAPAQNVPQETPPEMRKMSMEEMAAPSQEFANSPVGQLYKKAEPYLNYDLLKPAQDMIHKLPESAQLPATALGSMIPGIPISPLNTLSVGIEQSRKLVDELGKTMPTTAGIVSGVMDSTDQAIHTLFTPVNIGTALLGGAVPKLAKPLSTGFGVMMGEGAVESGKQAYDAPDARSRTKALMDMVMMGVGSGVALKHGLGGPPQIPTGLEAPLINKLSVDLEKINANEAMGKKIIKAEPQVSEVPSIENFDASVINQETPTPSIQDQNIQRAKDLIKSLNDGDIIEGDLPGETWEVRTDKRKGEKYLVNSQGRPIREPTANDGFEFQQFNLLGYGLKEGFYAPRTEVIKPQNLTKEVPMPESPLTLGKQIDSLVKGDSPAVLVTPGSTRPITPKGMRTVETDVGTFIYDPKKISPNVIRNQVAAGEHGKILGHVEPKSADTTIAVQAREGPIEVKTSIVQPENVAAQKKSLKKQYPEAEIEVKPLEEKLPELIEQRQQPVMGKTKGEHLDYLRSLIEQADAGKRQGHVDEFGNQVNTSYGSSFPIKDLGSKKSQLKIIEKVKSGEVLTDNQQQIYSMMEDFVKKSRTAEAKKYLLKRKQPVEMATGDLALKEGDKVKIPGDTLKVIESTDEKLVLKDGKKITLDPVFDTLEVEGGNRGIIRGENPTLIDNIKAAEKERASRSRWDPETKARQSKAFGFEMSAIQRGIERKPTGKEVQNARKYLESNHVGKIVQVDGLPAYVEKTAFGKTGVRFPNGELKYVGKDKISSNPISHEQVLDHIEKEAKEQLQNKADLYGIKETQPNSVKVPQENVKVEAPTVAKTETVRQPVQKTSVFDLKKNLADLGVNSKDLNKLALEGEKSGITPQILTDLKNHIAKTVDGIEAPDLYKISGKKTWGEATKYDVDRLRELGVKIPDDVFPVQKVESDTRKISPQGEKLKSRVYERLQEEHPEILTDDVKYNKMTIKDEVRRSVELLEQDPERAHRIAKGYEEAGEFNPTTTNIALAEKALADGNHSLYGDLVKKRSLDLTKKGQDIVAEKASVTDNSTAKYVKELLQSRADNIKLSAFKSMKRKTMGKKMSKAEVVTDAINQEVVKLKEKVSSRKMNIKEAQDFLERLKCR